jgi:hypothetical protein
MTVATTCLKCEAEMVPSAVSSLGSYCPDGCGYRDGSGEFTSAASVNGNGSILVPDEQVTVTGLPEQDTGALLGEIRELMCRFVVLPGDHEADTLALFVAHTHAIKSAHATPYLIVVSPERRAGKTLLLEVLEQMVSRAWRIVAVSEAAMFRKIAQDLPTLLLDEIDAIFGSNSERTEPLRALLNAGNRPGASVARCVGQGDEVRVADFDVFCPKILAGIDNGRLPDTIRDRGIELHMKRKTSAESVERFRLRHVAAEMEELRARLTAWVVGAEDELREADPELPEALNDRAAEAWEPLLAIAGMAGHDWPARARAAAVALADGESEEATRGTRVLGKLADAIADRQAVSTEEVLHGVNADDELPFGGWRDGRGLDPRTLARLLKPYGVRPRTVKLPDGSTAKGYHRDGALEEAFARYLPPTPLPPSPPSPPSPEPESVTQIPHEQRKVTQVTQVTDSEQGVTDSGGEVE